MNFKRLLGLRQSVILGLDIGSSSVKIVRLNKQGDGYSVTTAGMVEIEACDDDQDRLLAKARATQDCLRTLDIATKVAVCGVCGPDVAVRDFRFPSLSRDEIDGAIMLEAKQVCPFNTDEGTVDYHITSDENEQTRGILVAATNSLIEEKSQVARRASLNCVMVDVDGLALLNCYEAWEKQTDVPMTALLNVGSSWTTLAILGEDGMPFIRDITFGGDSIISQIADDNDTEPEVIKQCLGGDWAIPEFDIASNLAKASEKLILDVSRTLRYYAAQEQSDPVERILVCGGFALAKGFVDLLNSRIGVEVVLWNPLEAMAFEGNGHCRDTIVNRGPALAVATGLAMRSI